MRETVLDLEHFITNGSIFDCFMIITILILNLLVTSDKRKIKMYHKSAYQQTLSKNNDGGFLRKLQKWRNYG